MIKKIIKLFFQGAAFGSVILVIIGIFHSLEIFTLLPYFFDDFAVYALACIAIGVAFSVSSIVYDIDAPALWLKVVINVFAGFGTVFLTGFFVGLIYLQSPSTVIFAFAANIVIYIVIALGDYLLNGRDAKKINAKLRALEIKRQNTEQSPEGKHRL